MAFVANEAILSTEEAASLIAAAEAATAAAAETAAAAAESDTVAAPSAAEPAGEEAPTPKVDGVEGSGAEILSSAMGALAVGAEGDAVLEAPKEP